MKKVVLKAMSLVNFRGHQNFSVRFSNETTISGDNRLGKSTIFDAFVWLLFGKDQFDRKDHEIIPIVDGKRMERVDSEVSAVLDVDGREMNIKRVLHQKWVRRRGATEEVFDGCDTLYFMNDVPLKAGEFKARVDMMIEETVFKLITNPATFLGLHWQKQREFLFQIAGTISDAEVLDKMATLTNKQAIFNLTNILNSGKSLVEFKKELSVRKKKLQEELEKINPKIDQTTRLMPQQRDFATVEAELNAIDAQINDVEAQMADHAKAIRAQYESIQEQQKQVNDLKTQQQTVINNRTSENNQAAFNANQRRMDAQNALLTSKKRLSEAVTSLNDAKTVEGDLSAKIAIKSADITKLRATWEMENAKEYATKAGCLVCPVFGHDCGDASAKERHVEAQAKAKQAFADAQDAKLTAINADGQQMTVELDQLKRKLEVVTRDIANAAENVKQCEAEVAQKERDANIPEVPTQAVVPTEIAEWVEMEEQIKALQASMGEVKPVDTHDLSGRKQELVSKRDGLKATLADRDLIARFTAEITKLKAEAADYAQQIADIEKQEFTMAEFDKVRIDECERRVNNLFQIVKFQLFDKTIDGNEFPCCIPLNKAGVPISATNTAEKINAGLDVISTLSNFYNVSAPIFCDQAESVNRFLNAGSQMVFLRVTKEPVLTVTNN